MQKLALPITVICLFFITVLSHGCSVLAEEIQQNQNAIWDSKVSYNLKNSLSLMHMVWENNGHKNIIPVEGHENIIPVEGHELTFNADGYPDLEKTYNNDEKCKILINNLLMGVSPDWKIHHENKSCVIINPESPKEVVLAATPLKNVDKTNKDKFIITIDKKDITDKKNEPVLPEFTQI